MTRAVLIGALLLSACRDDLPCALEPGELDFGEQEATTTGAAVRFIKLRNPSVHDRVCTIEPLSAPFAVNLEGDVLINGLSEKKLTVSFVPRDGLLHRGELVLHSADGGCDVSMPLSGLGSGRLLANPAELEFTLGPGEVESKEVLIANGRRVAVPIAAGWSFGELGGPFVFELTDSQVPARGTAVIKVVAKADGTWNQRRSDLLIRAGAELLSVPVLLNPSSPRLEVTPLQVHVPRAGVGQFVERTFRIANTATSEDSRAPRLEIKRVEVRSGNSHEVTLRPLTGTTSLDGALLSERTAIEFAVRVEPSSPGPRTINLLITPGPDFLTPRELTFTTSAEVLPECVMEIVPGETLDLQAAGDGGVEGRVVFTNRGRNGCIVDNVRVRSATSSPYAMLDGAAQLEVPAGGSRAVTIAGPSLPPGIVGSFVFHVLREGAVDQVIALRLP